MKNKLKGFTLIETVLYIGLFSIILLMVVSFMLMTQQSAERTKKRGSLHQTSQFIIQHINYTFEKSISIDDVGSTFEIDQGKLRIIVDTLPKVYELLDQELFYDGIAISPPDILVEKFYLTPIYEDLDIIAVQIEVSLIDKKDTQLTEEINLLSTFR